MNFDLMSPMVPARYARGILDAAVARGLARDALLAAARIDEGQLLGRHARVSIIQFSRLYGGIAAGLQDEACGMHSRPTPPGAIETLCRAALTTATLEEYLPVAARGMNLMLGDLRAEYVPATEGRLARINFIETVTIAGDRQLAYELALLTIYGVMAWLFGRRVPLAAVHLPFARPRHAVGLRLLLAPPPQFGAPVACVEFAPEIMPMRVMRAPNEVARWMRRAPASIIEVLMSGAELSARIIGLLQQSMPQLLTLEEVAAHLAMSPRTLHRKLASQGESFQQIKDGWRLRIAVQRLSCTDMSVKQIAADLGFSDQATFRRAFAQWAGHPPGRYRQLRAPASG